MQDARRSCGVLQRSIPVPFSTRGPSSAGCLSGTLPSSISHADRQSKSWFASGNSPSKDHLYSRLIPSARGCGDRQNRTEYAVHFQFSDTRQTLFHDLRAVQDSALQAKSIRVFRSTTVNTQPVPLRPDSTVSTSKWPNSLRLSMLSGRVCTDLPAVYFFAFPSFRCTRRLPLCLRRDRSP